MAQGSVALPRLPPRVRMASSPDPSHRWDVAQPARWMPTQRNQIQERVRGCVVSSRWALDPRAVPLDFSVTSQFKPV